MEPGGHPALIDFAKQALRAEVAHLYQCQAWATFTGESDYDQPFHHATPEQLACFRVQPPGHPFWRPVTLARAQAPCPPSQENCRFMVVSR